MLFMIIFKIYFTNLQNYVVNVPIFGCVSVFLKAY